MENYEYRRGMGSFKPKFQSIPDEYYPLTTGEVAGYSALVVLTIGGCLGMMLGLMQWVLKEGLEGFVQVWSIIYLVFVIILIIAFFVGGRARIRESKKMIM